MKSSDILNMAIDLPKLFALQAINPLRLVMRKAATHPETSQEMADMVNSSISHKIRAGFTHRFIPLLFVTVGDRVFCRRYSYNEPSWHSAFRADPAGQIKLDKTVINIESQLPDDMDDIISDVDQAYADKLKKLGARFLLAGAVEERAQQSTMELKLINRSPRHGVN